MRECFALALERSVRMRGIKVAAVVGTILAAINHADALVRGPLPSIVCLKIALTYVVPYCVSTCASVQAIRQLNLSRERDAARAVYGAQEC